MLKNKDTTPVCDVKNFEKLKTFGLFFVENKD